MKPTVVKIDVSKLKELQRRLLESKESSNLSTKGEYEAFRMLFAGEAIIAYTSGKIVSNGPHSAAAVQNAVLNMQHKGPAQITIGSDEAGKGEWLGPMVVVAVALTPEQSILLQSLGVMDSKSLSVVRISELAKIVRANSLDVQTLVVSPERFNSQIEEFRKEGKNLNDLLAWAHSQVIAMSYEAIHKKAANIKVVIDQFARVKTEQRLAQKLDIAMIELVQRPKAEDETAVAAASIVARETRENWIDRASSKMDMDLRELNIKEANSRSDRAYFAKTSYIDSQLQKK